VIDIFCIIEPLMPTFSALLAFRHYAAEFYRQSILISLSRWLSRKQALAFHCRR